MLIVFGSNSVVNKEGLDLTATIIDPITRVVEGYANVPAGQDRWTFIAAPFKNGKTPTYVDNLFPVGEVGQPLVTSAEYDLYRFNQSATAEWENYKMHSGNFSIDGGAGYLYATKYARTMYFGGSVCAEDSNEVPLTYDASTGLAGWNLVGNPLMVPAYPNRPYYAMSEFGNNIEPVDTYSRWPIPTCTGIMVKAEGEGESITFSKTQQQQSSGQGGLHVAVAAHEATRDGSSSTTVQDKAIVSFNAGTNLSKFVFNASNAKLYIPQEDEDYAIAYSEKQGEMPLNFKAAENGSYTLTVIPEGVELEYLHLIDNQTGEDIGLLSADPSTVSGASYTFNATTADNESRFRLVFNASSKTVEESFAYYVDGEIVITADTQGATLQIVDMTGRILVCRDAASHVSTAGMAPGVYVLRLVNGNSVRTQKIVVR